MQIYVCLLYSWSHLVEKCSNKQFKNKMRSKYQAWMINSPFT